MGYDPQKIEPKRDWALILADERREALSSGIVIAVETGAEKVTEFAGKLVRLGPGSLNEAIQRQGATVNARVLYRGFLKYANPLEVDETWPSGAPKHYFFIDSKDILAVVPPGVEVGIFSGRPMVPHVQGDKSC